MNKARLEELRKIKTGFDFVMGLTPDWAEGRRAGLTDDQTEIIVNYVYQALSRNLLALIDAEIARQSVTDEQIRTALDYVSDYKKEAMEYDTSVGIFPPTSEEARAWETVETALRQYQKPTDEAVQRAIEWMEIEKELAQNAWERAGAEWRMEHGAQEQHDERVASFDLAIQALRQMRSAPCWYCKGVEAHGIKSVKTVTDESDRELGAYDTPYNFCPNCGRKLVK